MRIAFVKMKHVEFGGAETYLRLLAAGCARRGHDVHLITTAWPRERVEGWTLVLVPCSRRSRAARLLSFSAAAARAAREGRFDAVFSLDRTERQDVWRAGEGVHPVWLRRRHEFEPRWKTWFNEHSPGHRAILALERRCATGTPRIVANSRMIKRYLVESYGLPEERVTVIHNGVDLGRFSPAAAPGERGECLASLGIPAGMKLLLLVGSGFRLKGLPEALEALRGIPGAALAVLGRDRVRPWARLARRLGVADRVRFRGAVPATPALYRSADLTLLPSWSDSFGFTGLESLACGTPLVTTAYAGVSELVRPGFSGQVIPTPAHGLGRAVEEQLRLGRPPGGAGAIADSVKDFSVEHNVDMTIGVIESAARR